MQIRVARPEEGHVLQAFARDCFVMAFAHFNTPEDMALYLKDHLTIESIDREMKNKDSRFFLIEKKQADKLMKYSF